MNVADGVLEISPVPNKGRGLFARRDLRAGECVLLEEPFVHSVPDAAKKTSCSLCLRSLKRSESIGCPRCGEASFCDLACMESAVVGSTHSIEVCSMLRTLGSCNFDAETKDRIRAIAGIWDMKRSHSPRYGEFMALCGTAEQVRSPAGIVEFFSNVFPASRESDRQYMAREVLEWVSKEERNSFGVLETDGSVETTTRGSVLYTRAAYFNHSCLPNVARVDHFDGPREMGMRTAFVVLHDVPRGEELELSYTPLDWGLEDRQEYLREGYGFTCRCERCKTESTWDEEDRGAESHQIQAGNDMEAYLHMFLLKYACMNGECGGTLVPAIGGNQARCNVCGIVRSESEFLACLEQDIA